VQSRTYVVGQSRIQLIFGDITHATTEVVVSSDDALLSMGGGVSAAIRRAGGASIATDAAKLTPARVGDVIVSTAGNLRAKYVLHAITLGVTDDGLPMDLIVRQTTHRVMQLLPLLGCTSVAFPAIGAGVARIPYEVVASQMAAVLVDNLIDDPAAYSVELWLSGKAGHIEPHAFFAFFEAFATRLMGVATAAAPGLVILQPPGVSPAPMDAHQVAESERHHRVYEMLRHLDARRDQLEARLLAALTATDHHADQLVSQLRSHLVDVGQLRSTYAAELATLAKDDAAPADSVFVSSTYVDLSDHRKQVRSVIDRLQMRFVGMEEFIATEHAPVNLIRQKVQESQIYCGILGMRYGSVDPGTGLSMTELEYRQAIASGKRICMFVMSDGASITPNMVERDPDAYRSLIDFKQRVLQSHVCALFTDPQDLATRVEAALRPSA